MGWFEIETHYRRDPQQVVVKFPSGKIYALNEHGRLEEWDKKDGTKVEGVTTLFDPFEGE